MSAASEFLWYIPNQIEPGHRGDTAGEGHNSLESLLEQATALETHGWKGALLGTSWGRPDTFTVATALTARTRSFEPLIAVRPGYWQPAHLASAAATLDHLGGGRIRINIVSGLDSLEAYGDHTGHQPDRYGRTREFMRLVRRLWTETGVNFEGAHYNVRNSTVEPRIRPREGRRHPKLYFGGASAAAEQVAATEADVQLFWGEPLAGVAERIDRLKALSRDLDRDLPPLEFGLRITTFVRETTRQAWAEAEAAVAAMAAGKAGSQGRPVGNATGQQRLLALQAQGEVLDENLYTTPGKYGGAGAGTTWLVGSPEDVAASLRRYRDLGVSHFVLSDTPYLREIRAQGERLLPLLAERSEGRVQPLVPAAGL